MKVGRINYYLVYRISGWSDKTEIFELYNTQPHFNHCSVSQVEPIFGDSLVLSKTIKHVYLNTAKKKLDIEYIDGDLNEFKNMDVKLEIKNSLMRASDDIRLEF